MPDNPHGRPRSFRLDGFAVLSISVSLRAATLALQALIARTLAVENFDFYILASIVGALIAMAGDLGLTSTVVFTARGDARRARLILASLRRRRLTSALLLWILGTAVTQALWHTLSLASAFTATLIVGSFVVQAYSRFLRTPLLAGQQPVRESKLEFRDKILSIVGAALPMIFSRSLLFVAVGQAVGALCGYIVVRRAVPGIPSQPLVWSRSAVQYGIRLSAAILATQLYARLDYLVLTQFANSRQTAVYAAAYNLVLGLTLAPIALTQVAMAHLMRATPNDKARREYLALALLAGIIGGVAIAAGGGPAVRIVFHLNDPQLSTLCIVLGVAFVFMSMNSTIGVLGPSAGDDTRYVGTVAAALVVSLGACFVFIPTLGIIGGALATLTTELFVTLGWRLYRPRHKMPLRQPPNVTVGQG